MANLLDLGPLKKNLRGKFRLLTYFLSQTDIFDHNQRLLLSICFLFLSILFKWEKSMQKREKWEHKMEKWEKIKASALDFTLNSFVALFAHFFLSLRLHQCFPFSPQPAQSTKILYPPIDTQKSINNSTIYKLFTFVKNSYEKSPHTSQQK